MRFAADGRLIADYAVDMIDFDNYVVRLIDEHGKTLATGESFYVDPSLRTRERQALFAEKARVLRVRDDRRH